MLDVLFELPRAGAQVHGDRLRPARDRRQRAAALPGARARQPAALDRGSGALRTGARAETLVLHDPGHGRRHGGDPQGRRCAHADAVRDLLWHRAGARLLARLPRARRPHDPRLRGGSGRERSVRARRLPRDGAVAGRALPRPLPRRERRPRRRPRGADRQAARGAAERLVVRRARAAALRARCARSRSPICSTTPTTTPRCAPACRWRCERRSTTTTPRRCCGCWPAPTPSRVPSDPRDFSAARYAARLRGDAAAVAAWHRRSADRLAVARARALALPGSAFAPFDAEVAYADEIDLCLRWPDSAGRRARSGGAYPAVPTLLLQGQEDLRTPPEVSAHVATLIAGARRVTAPGVGHAVIGLEQLRPPPAAALRRGQGRARDAARGVPTDVPATGVPPVSFAALAPARRARGPRGEDGERRRCDARLPRLRALARA